MASAIMMSSSSSTRILPSELRVSPFSSNAQLIRRSVFVPMTRCSAEKPSSPDGFKHTNTDELPSKSESSSSVQKPQPLKASSTGSAAPIPPQKAAPVSFQSVMTFSGAGPETINGRLAMLGFVCAVAKEIATHETVLEQVSTARFPILAIMLLFSSASLIPLLSGKNPNSSNFGPFNAQAELLNGRIAMLGFSGLILAEAIQGLPLIH